MIRGHFRMDYKAAGRDVAVELREGEFLIMPRGVEHRPVADEEVEILLFEPASTLNTGNVRGSLTADTFRAIVVAGFAHGNFLAYHLSRSRCPKENFGAGARTQRKARRRQRKPESLYAKRWTISGKASMEHEMPSRPSPSD